MFDFETVIIGAGVIGLALARELAKVGQEVLVLDKEKSFGMGTSSRNSEVIHAGMYYRVGSSKAKHCVAGRKLLYDYCEEKGVNHLRIGKLIVATKQSEVEVLLEIQRRSIENGWSKMIGLRCSAKVRLIKWSKNYFVLPLFIHHKQV